MPLTDEAKALTEKALEPFGNDRETASMESREKTSSSLIQMPGSQVETQLYWM